MTKKESNKKDKKKLLILILLLFAVIGVTGYGAYSYFWTQGSFSGTSDSVSVASFDPETSVNGFVGSGGSVTLTCPDSTMGNETVDCTGTVTVYNNGGTDITVSTSSISANTNDLSDDNVTATVGTPNFSWSNTTIAANNSENLTITVPVTLSSDFGSSESVSRSTPYNGDTYDGYDDAIEVTVDFNLKAAQVHN